MCPPEHTTSSVNSKVLTAGAQFAWNVVKSFEARPAWLRDEDTFSTWFILSFFVICFVGSLPQKIAALRYFTFITAIINLLLGGLLIWETSKVRPFYEHEAKYENFILDEKIWGSYCLSLFSSVNQFSVVNVLSEYKEPTERRINKLIMRSPIIPILVYLSVSVAGYQTCGDKCEEIIIDREVPNGYNDILMTLCKVGLLVCLVVGVIIRNQSNKATVFGILEQFRKIQQDDRFSVHENKPLTNDLLSANNTQDEDAIRESLNESQNNGRKSLYESDKPSSIILTEKIDQTPTSITMTVQAINALIPAVTAVLVKDALITYVEAGSGFLAPVFLIIYPCLITIRLHQNRVAPLSRTKYVLVNLYMYLASAASYIALVLNFLYSFKFLD